MEEEVTVYETRNAVEIGPGIIDCEILHPTKGWLPFTSIAEDPADHGKSIHADFVAGRRSKRAMTPQEAQARAAMKRGILEAVTLQERDALLTQSDYIGAFDVWPTLSPAKKLEWTTYRQDLRDLTEQEGFPETCVWPVKP
jgi:hypothetical protein